MRTHTPLRFRRHAHSIDHARTQPLLGHSFLLKRASHLPGPCCINYPHHPQTSAPDASGKSRALPLAGKPGFRGLLAAFKINGQDMADRVESGATLSFDGGVSVHMPAAKHSSDKSSFEANDGARGATRVLGCCLRN